MFPRDGDLSHRQLMSRDEMRLSMYLALLLEIDTLPQEVRGQSGNSAG
jgi:hypothetical protein